ncbi:MAG: putative manganese-dependent inorganic diphosphatase [Planctomycetes bacterium]|nr:putative manganese-dependent inorganic diphosphatase [Planctomycetota bacterium]
MRSKNKIIYVIGHRNPDTDSIVAAAAYAAFKKAMGVENCYAARAGKPTPQTEYIFSRFKVPLPRFVPDLLPKAAYYYNPRVKTISADISLWEAMSVLEQSETRALPVVDAEGRYHSLLHYSFFAQKLLKMINPRQKTAIHTSVELVSTVLHAQALVLHNEHEMRKSPIIIAASEFESFRHLLATNIPENTIVICGNRADVHRHAIETGVRLLVATNGYMLDKHDRALAEEKGVSVLVSPYDTSSTALLIIYSMPAVIMSNSDLKAVNLNDSVRKIGPALSSAPGKALPVVNDHGVVVGIISESDIYQEPHIDVILVDHNEPSQAVEGIEHYKILEIIDHHRLGSLSTRYPITFINKPVGATCTIIANLYQENRIPLTAEIASILLCGILADTLGLQSATTTDTDRETAEYLANITNLEIDELTADLMAAASNITGRTAEELIHQDMKEYQEFEYSFTVSQMEVEEPHEVLERKEEFLTVLEAERTKGGNLFSALLVTDITVLSSLLLLAADPAFLKTIDLPRQEESVYIMRDVVSRKKQLMPILSEMVEKFQDTGTGVGSGTTRVQMRP